MADSDDMWIMLPLLLLMYMSGTKEWGVPILMALMMTHTLTTLLPNPIPVLDFNPVDAPSPRWRDVLASSTAVLASTETEPAAVIPPPEPTLAREKVLFREHATQFIRALPGLWNQDARAAPVPAARVDPTRRPIETRPGIS
jgi:hypothetical protein